MGYVYRCPKCSKKLEENDLMKFRNIVSKHFKNHHPEMDSYSSVYGKWG